MRPFKDMVKDYPMLRTYAEEMKPLTFDVKNRDDEIADIQSAFLRDKVTNVFMIGDPGVGKTTLVRHILSRDHGRKYVEVDLVAMADTDSNEPALVVASRLKTMFREVEKLADELLDEGVELVLFIDEAHLLFQTSSNAVEAIKPALADSGNRGLRVIMATTFDEFYKYKIGDNEPFIQRFVILRLFEPAGDEVVEMLEMDTPQDVLDAGIDPTLYRAIVDVTNRYDLSARQPRKALMLFDAMVGYFRLKKCSFDKNLLAYMMKRTKGVNIAISVDAAAIRRDLDNRVFDQRLASHALEIYGQIMVAGMNDPKKPLASFLFTGPSGVGKTEMALALAQLFFNNTSSILRVDMSEFSAEGRELDLMRVLTRGVTSNPYTVVLLDEVEKAAPACSRLLLQVLDTGALSDENGRKVSFANCIVIGTTNVASEIYKSIHNYAKSDDEESEFRALKPLVKKSLTNSKSFPTELINRFNDIVIFGGLLKSTKEQVASTKLDELCRDFFEKHGVVVRISSIVVPWLVYQRDGADNEAEDGGARGIHNIINAEIRSAISRAVNMTPGIRELHVTVDSDPEQPDVSKKRTLQFTSREGASRSNKDRSRVFVGSAVRAQALTNHNQKSLDDWRVRALELEAIAIAEERAKLESAISTGDVSSLSMTKAELPTLKTTVGTPATDLA